MTQEDKKMVLEMRVAALEAQMAEMTGRKSDEGEKGMSAEDVPQRPLDGALGQAFAYGFDGTDFKFTNCCFMFGRRMHQIMDQMANEDGTYHLIVPHNNPEEATVTNIIGKAMSNPEIITQITSDESTDTLTIIPLVMIQDGKILIDYRGMPCIPVYE